MAADLATAEATAWASALANLRALQAADLPPPGSSPHVVRSADADLAAAEVALLDLPAQTLSAVIDKLAMIWEFQLDGDGEDARHRRLVLGDLRRLAFYLP